MFAVKFVAMTVPFADLELAVSLMRERSRLQFAWPSTQAHRAAHFVHAKQFTQFVNHAIWGLRIKFRAVRLLQSGDVTGIFNRCALHPQANSKKGNLVLARKLNRINHPLNAALAKSARY